VGSGFGIYGWGIAVLENKNTKLHTLSRYKKNILKIISIKELFTRVIFYKNLKELINHCELLIIAKRPGDQSRVVSKIIQLKKRINLILEKPISNNANNAIRLLRKISKSKINYLIGMTINETNWAKKLKKLLKKKKINKVNIKWNFLAHHYKYNKKNWKRYSNNGGGTLNFYLIHLIYIFSFTKEWKIKYNSKDKTKEDSGGVLILKNTDTEIIINCNSNYKKKPFFRIKMEYKNFKKEIIKLKNPFEENKKKKLILNSENRIELLKRILKNAYKNKWCKPNETEKHLNLWKKICMK
jgi:predicted dehydrogenase